MTEPTDTKEQLARIEQRLAALESGLAKVVDDLSFLANSTNKTEGALGGTCDQLHRYCNMLDADVAYALERIKDLCLKVFGKEGPPAPRYN